ncbi:MULTISPECIES: polysaccharide deacetylase family protein [unclassified Myroides]|uniref:polysaccharide deacetylase family protein n=1 Tax=unclassified Myroides TaxID=2642485 RepID=UPI0015F86CCF|nr:MULTISPECIES: polysaccharide deacetylase family protein [unclassified Myroides]MBB1150588.1 polysaccharide deacetylase family protein [Myroides sp. NP-2]MDM1407181.1 polysaccharide deacetylase family protein [Myroides sp. DF42-4-2]
MSRFLSFLFPQYTWKRTTSEKVVYLTFDDGPIPGVTEWVLDLLKEQQIKATFFCIGDNIRKHPHVFQRLLAEKHQVGNHTFNHLKGWKTPLKEYIANFHQCQQEIEKHQKPLAQLFRPPYGKIKKEQGKYIVDQGYEVIMWSLITKDYEAKISPQACLNRTLKRVKPGSIIVFHDSIKAEKNMKYTLPLLIKHLKEKGYSFALL